MHQETKNWIRLLLLAVVWGSSFFLIKRALYYENQPIFDFYQIGSSRMIFAGLILLPFALKKFNYLFTKSNLILLFIVGFFGNFTPAFLFAFAEESISSGLAGMLNSSTPVFTVLFGLIFFQQKFIKLQALGVLTGSIGISLLIITSSNLNIEGSTTAILAAVFATLCYATSLNVIKFKLGHLKPLEITSLGFFTTLPFALIIFFHQGTPQVFYTNEYAWFGMVHILILGIVGTALAVIIFNRLIADSTPVFASSVTYFIPVVAVIIGFLDGEKLSIVQFISMLVILLGVYIINKGSIRQKSDKKLR